jgi:LuxR family glucitol operon transcriptional activator
MTLLKDIEERISKGGLRPDFVVVSGDVAFRSEEEEYRLAGRFFDLLLRTTGLSEKELFIVPGNHDVDWNMINEQDETILASLTNRKKVESVLDDGLYRPLIFRKFHEYDKFVASYFKHLFIPHSPERYWYVRHTRVAGCKIALLGLNSAWGVSKQGNDYGRLILGEHQIRGALGEVEENSHIVIAVLHHPFQFYREFEQNACRSLLLVGCNFILHGHNHHQGLCFQSVPGAKNMIVAAGAAYSKREEDNCYNIVRLDLEEETGTIYLRRYSDEQGGFWTVDSTTYRDTPAGEYKFSLADAGVRTSVPEHGGESLSLERGLQHNLPHPAKFIGREAELTRIRKLLSREDVGLVAISGTGGIGKTALALQLAHYFRRSYDVMSKSERFDAIIWFSAKTSEWTPNGVKAEPWPRRTLKDIYAVIAITLGCEDIVRHSRNQDERVKRALGQQRTLLIIDNLESIDDERVDTFLRNLPCETKAIVTTRVRRERGNSVSVPALSEKEGLELIARECDDRGVNISEEESKGLFQLTSGIPLAIQWSVGRLAYGHRIDTIFGSLGGERDNILSFLFSGALESIKDEKAYDLLLSLSLFSDPVDEDMLQHVAQINDRALLYDELSKLERLSLIIKRDDRYSLLPLTKRFVSKHVNEPFLSQARKRQVDCLIKLGEPRTFYHPFRRENYEKIRANLQTILDVIQWCCEAHQCAVVIDLVTTIQDFLAVAGFWSERVDLAEKALEAARRLNDEKALAFLYTDTLGWVAMTRGEREQALAWICKGLEYAARTNYREAECMAMRYMSRLTRSRHEALKYLVDAERLAEQLGSPGFKAGVAMSRAYYEMSEKNLKEAEKWMKRSRDGFRQVGDFLRSARKDVDLGSIYIKQGRLPEARDLLKQSVSVFEEMKVRGTEDNLAFAYSCLGRVEAESGYRDAAIQCYHKAQEIYRLLGSRESEKRTAEKIEELRCSGPVVYVEEVEQVYDRLRKLGREAFLKGTVSVDPNIAKLENDKRRGITLIAKPSETCIKCFCDVLQQIQKILPNQYFYHAQDFHITVLTLVDAHEGFQVDANKVSLYNNELKDVFSSFSPFDIVFHGILVTHDVVMVRGHLKSNMLNEIRDALRSRLKACGLGDTLDPRYKTTTAHAVIARFIRRPDNSENALQQLEELSEVDLGVTRVDTIYFVYNDWVMSHDRIEPLHTYRLEAAK